MLKRSTILNKESVDTLAIGSFDGIHLGHRELIRRLGPHGALFVIDKDQANLTPGIKRSEYTGYPCMFYHFLKVQNLSGAEFVALLKKEFINLHTIVVGYDFCFGHNRSCHAEDLKTYFDGNVMIVPAFTYQGMAIHSSAIRSFLTEGKLEDANRFLGREYAIVGDAIAGQGIGEKELVPTLNLKVMEYLIPKEGVYATRTRVDAMVYDSVSFVGHRLSTDGSFAVETHLLDAHIDGKPKNVGLIFVAYLRDNQKFETLVALKEQISKDINEAKGILPTCRLYLSDFL